MVCSRCNLRVTLSRNHQDLRPPKVCSYPNLVPKSYSTAQNNPNAEFSAKDKENKFRNQQNFF
jgi:hypothetical protein